MSRLPVMSVDEYSDKQRKIHDRITSGKRGGFRGPFHMWVHSAGYLDVLEKVGGFLRYDSALSPRLSEMAILITARFWKAQYEWFAHEPHALKGGLDPEIIKAISESRRPENMQPDEEALYDFCTALHETHEVSDAVFQKALDQFGQNGVIDVIGLIGHYTGVSMTLNACQVEIPDGKENPLK
ncbi:MAG: carboxymuconolactone decarboxylase family protein [Nitrospinaceae bacterium]|jgi:4-carboxymuconolactone decarboxylase|nr:carboxymuconolactone decarboxylase family protein [Nitrospinaceae bacterium]MBT3433458.1 carboxymuconolactone decarboxylase family protein [Nitrospinaceae bacterium]MBT3820176.1 carboxymuconolactone decarboxylase family protein [Nitrospinaceae bacterium]MBT4094933.1 carboxymuconolactone decarboxylase family protein [Nitrospinaceae bacterium]MBT4430953.1 carboxymuconolactone decarboxylase family protein [Nitrospinaceae bacterium]